ncbi:MAG TPA: diguanylate cyclase [bacterium]|jgi:two-component system cell cycle response regulator|nr:diguanylate cyclase [bacterium]
MPAPTRILLVEDNPSDRDFLNACLSTGAHEVELDFAARLTEASTRLKDRRYELVIADLNLPDGEGLDTFFKVKELAEDAAIVVMTGMDDAQLASRAVLAGAQDYLVKGEMDPERVWRALFNALFRHDQFQRVSHVAQDLRKKNSSLRELAYVDSMTGLLNRHGLAKTLASAASLGPRTAVTHALVVDVDDFQNVNELFGYHQGDLALKEIGRRLRANLGPSDIGGRVGGDEFLLLLAGVDTPTAIARADRIRVSVRDAALGVSGAAFGVTVSVGVAALGKGPFTVERLLELTEGGLKAGKGGGKNRVCFDGGPVSVGPLSGQASSLARVPFYEIGSGCLAGYQFMVPGELGRADERTLTVDNVRALVRTAAETGEGLECHVRISLIQLMRLLPEHLAMAPEIDPRLFRLSIPMVPMSPIPAGLLASVRRMRAAGWRIGLHGLDLGPHVWANLILLEPSVVSLDPGLVSGVSGNAERERGLTRLCHVLSGLGAQVVADGVGTEEDFKLLDQLGVSFGSGPLWKEKRP